MITGVDILKIYMEILLFKIFRNFIADICTYICKFYISRSIGLIRLCEKFLPSTFRNNDYGMMTFFQTFFQMFKQSVFTVKIERNFRDKTEIRFVACKSCCRSDKARFTSHKFYKSDSVYLRIRFHMNGGNSFFCALYGSFKTERAVNKLKIVINCFRNTDYRALYAAFFNFIRNIKRTALSSVSADNKQHIYVHSFDAVDDFNNALSATAARS